MELSVIIPTYNRLSVLSRCLDAVSEQARQIDGCEVLVIDDGSKDKTLDFLSTLPAPPGVSMRVFSQSNRGPAAARNIGIRQASGRIILFLGDDILAGPGLLLNHLHAHARHPADSAAVLGLTTWNPFGPVTPFMRWLENGGPQFKYWAIQDENNVGYGHFYSSNLSLKRQFLLENGLFDEDFPFAAYEDIELGHRLELKGMRLIFCKDAVGYHEHPTRLEGYLKRMEMAGRARVIFLRKTGKCGTASEFGMPSSFRPFSHAKFLCYRAIGSFAERRWILPKIYSYLTDRAAALGSLTAMGNQS